jgi:hypothetical protein
MARTTLIASALFLGLAPLGACSCEDETLTEVRPGTCEPDFDCQQGFTYRRGECRVARCTEDSDCCPGQRCSAAAGLCADQWVACTDDSECGEIPGQRCIDFRGGRFCGYPNATGALTEAGTQACSSDADCPRGTACVGERCLSAAPCGGGCPDGEVCDIDSNTCFSLPSCTETCMPGQVLVVADPETMSGDACCLVECACAPLPPVPEGQYGWHASLAASPGGSVVSAYDAQYGDLVVASFDASGQPGALEYVDGFPSDGPVEANPTGRRGGRARPGPDVGEYTSIARDNAGHLHVAYYDRTNGDLKYARRMGETWTTHTVDAEGDVGRFTSIAVGPEGRPRISFMAAEVMGPMNRTFAELRYAEASRPSPSGPGDWTITGVDRREKPAPVCGGGCGRDEACVDLGPGPACAAEVSACGSCGSDEACVMGPNGAECAVEIPTLALDDLPRGTGLFSSLVLTATGSPQIVYYDRIGGDLRLARFDGAQFRLRTLDGADPMRPADVGAHASAALTPEGSLAVAYMDFTSDDLVYLDVASGTREIVDDGVTPPDLRMVGADASLVFDPAGRPAIAYQDGTRLDLVYARRTGSPPMWSTRVVRGAPPSANAMGTAAGFYATQDVAGGRAHVASVAVGFDPESNLQLELTVDPVDLD